MPRSTPSIREQIHAMLEKATGYGNTYEAQRLFARMTGSLQLAVLINQLLYWSERATRPDGAVYKTSADWEEECVVSGYAVRQFNMLPFIETSLHRANNIPTTHYCIRGGMLLQMVAEYLASHAKPAHKAHAHIDEGSFSIQHHIPAKPTNADVETYEPLTSITPDTTPSTTASRGKTQKKAPPVDSDRGIVPKVEVKTKDRQIKAESPSRFSKEGAARGSQAESPSQFSKEGAARGSQAESPSQFSKEGAARGSQQFELIIAALAEVTGCDPGLRSHAARLERVARELMQAGYTPEAVRNFTHWWRANDFRWKKDKQLPTPEDVLKLIPRARPLTANDYAASWAYVATLKNMTGER